MATVTEAVIRNLLNVKESLEDAPAVTIAPESDSFDRGTEVLDADSTPPVTKAAQWQPTIPNAVGSSSSSSSSGDELYLPAVEELEIDLTNLPGLQGSFSGAGLKVRYLRLGNPASNEGPVTIGPGDSNAYDLFGNLAEMVIPVGGRLTFEPYDGAPEVSGSAKIIKLRGCENDAYEMEILLG